MHNVKKRKKKKKIYLLDETYTLSHFNVLWEVAQLFRNAFFIGRGKSILINASRLFKDELYILFNGNVTFLTFTFAHALIKMGHCIVIILTLYIFRFLYNTIPLTLEYRRTNM